MWLNEDGGAPLPRRCQSNTALAVFRPQKQQSGQLGDVAEAGKAGQAGVHGRNGAKVHEVS